MPSNNDQAKWKFAAQEDVEDILRLLGIPANGSKSFSPPKPEPQEPRKTEAEWIEHEKENHWNRPSEVNQEPHRVEWVGTHQLLRFREFDRHPGVNDGGEYVSPQRYKALTEHIAEHGVKSPLVLEYNPDKGTAHLGEGNHRLAIAEDLFIPRLPVRVNRSRRESPGEHPVTLKPDKTWYNHRNELWIPESMLPSHLGIPTVGPPKTASNEHWDVQESDFDPENSAVADYGYTHHPYMADPATGIVWIGPIGSHHIDLAQHHQVGGGRKDPYSFESGAIQHDHVHPYPGCSDAVTDAVCKFTGHPLVPDPNADEDFTFGKVADFNRYEPSDTPEPDDWDFEQDPEFQKLLPGAVDPTTTNPWTKGRWGKGYLLNDGSIHHWETNGPHGSPHHQEVGRARGEAHKINDYFTIEPGGHVPFDLLQDPAVSKPILHKVLPQHRMLPGQTMDSGYGDEDFHFGSTPAWMPGNHGKFIVDGDDTLHHWAISNGADGQPTHAQYMENHPDFEEGDRTEDIWKDFPRRTYGWIAPDGGAVPADKLRPHHRQIVEQIPGVYTEDLDWKLDHKGEGENFNFGSVSDDDWDFKTSAGWTEHDLPAEMGLSTRHPSMYERSPFLIDHANKRIYHGPRGAFHREITQPQGVKINSENLSNGGWIMYDENDKPTEVDSWDERHPGVIDAVQHVQNSKGVAPHEEEEFHFGNIIKEADKFNDFLMNPKSRPDLQTPEAQQFLGVLGQHYHNPGTDQMLPWLTREWKKKRVEYAPDGHLQYQVPGVPEPTRLTPARMNTWAEWYNSKHPTRQGVDLMQKKIHEVHDFSQQHQNDLKADEPVKPSGEVQHQLPNGWTVQKLTSPEALTEEGDRMGHCVGGYHDMVSQGKTKVYSLRDDKNVPHVTMEVRPHEQSMPLERPHDVLFYSKIRSPEGIALMNEYAKDRTLRAGYAEHELDDPAAREHHELIFDELPRKMDNIRRNGFANLASHDELYRKLFPGPPAPPQGPHAGLVEQIQGQGNTIPKPEYQAMIKHWMNTVPEDQRPEWKKEDNVITDYDELDGEGYGGGYFPHGEYGIKGGQEPEYDWEGIIGSLGDRYHMHDVAATLREKLGHPDHLTPLAKTELRDAINDKIREFQDDHENEFEDMYFNGEYGHYKDDHEHEDFLDADGEYDPDIEEDLREQHMLEARHQHDTEGESWSRSQADELEDLKKHLHDYMPAAPRPIFGWTINSIVQNQSSITAENHRFPGEEHLDGQLGPLQGLGAANGVNSTYKSTINGNPVFVKEEGNFHEDDLAKERAAWVVAKRMGVPAAPTVVRRFPEGHFPLAEHATVQESVGTRTGFDAGFSGGSGQSRFFQAHPEDARRLGLFDHIIGNEDRHPGNWVHSDVDDRPHAIDHGGAFTPQSYAPYNGPGGHLAGKPLTDEEHMHVISLSKDPHLMDNLRGAGLSSKHIGPMYDRINQMAKTGQFLPRDY